MLSLSFPLILFLIPVITLVWYLFFREKFGSIHPNALVRKHLKTPNIIWILWIIRTLLVSFLVLSVSGVHIIQTSLISKKVVQDIMIVFDISLSMLAEDITPNRIETAKSVVKNFITSRTDDRIGLIIFAGRPFVSVPFSTDYSGIKSIISGLTPYLIRQDLPGLSGTNIGDAILLANMEYSLSQSPEKSIILLTDGRANIGIDPLMASDDSKSGNIKIYPVGIGSASGGDLFYTNTYGQKTYFYDEHGNVLKSDLDETMMRKIAESTHGRYFGATSRIELEQVFADISKNLPNKTLEKMETRSIDLYLFFIVLFSILLLIERSSVRYIMRKYNLREIRQE